MGVNTNIGPIMAQVDRITAIKAEQAPDARVKESCLFEQGEKVLQVYSQRNTDLISAAYYLNMLYENTDNILAGEATSLRDQTAGEYQLYIGIFGNMYHDHADLMDCMLLTSVPS